MRKFLLSGFLIIFITMQTLLNAYVKHGPVIIQNDNDFTKENGVARGSGNPYDPYVIDGWDIEVPKGPFKLGTSTIYGVFSGITISATTRYFTIRNCYIHDGKEDSNGIFLHDANNGNIENVKIERTTRGIYSNWGTIESITNTTISNCSQGILNNTFGIIKSITNCKISFCENGINNNVGTITSIKNCTISSCNYGVYNKDTIGSITNCTFPSCKNTVYNKP